MLESRWTLQNRPTDQNRAEGTATRGQRAGLPGSLHNLDQASDLVKLFRLEPGHKTRKSGVQCSDTVWEADVARQEPPNDLSGFPLVDFHDTLDNTPKPSRFRP